MYFLPLPRSVPGIIVLFFQIEIKQKAHFGFIKDIIMGNVINVNSLDALANHGLKKISVAFGVFDGVHLGHQHLINRLIAMSKKTGADSVVITFFPHPREILAPDEPILLLVSRNKKIKLLAELGVKAVVTLPFTEDFSALNAEIFLDDCLFAPGVEITGICVGSDWRFGKNGEGSIETIKHYADVHHFEFDPVDELVIDGVTVSSTAIRRAVSGGLLNEAKKMLGRNYSLSGVVVSGDAIGSSMLECPTANISVSHGIIPPNGVYAGYALCDGERYPAAISVGTSPTFAGKKRCSSDIEIHLLNFSGNLYGRELETEFVEYIREERCYPSGEALKKQVMEDIEKIRNILL